MSCRRGLDSDEEPESPLCRAAIAAVAATVGVVVTAPLIFILYFLHRLSGD